MENCGFPETDLKCHKWIILGGNEVCYKHIKVECQSMKLNKAKETT